MEVPLTEKGKTKRMGDGRGYQKLSFGHVKFEISINILMEMSNWYGNIHLRIFNV